MLPHSPTVRTEFKLKIYLKKLFQSLSFIHATYAFLVSMMF